MQVLEEIFKSKKPDHTDQFNLRIHRGLSWLKKATDLDDDLDDVRSANKSTAYKPMS